MNLSPTTGSCRYRDWSTSSFLMNCVQSSSSTEEGSKKFERLFFVFFIFCRLNIHHRFLIGLMHYWWDLRTSSCKKNKKKTGQIPSNWYSVCWLNPLTDSTDAILFTIIGSNLKKCLTCLVFFFHRYCVLLITGDDPAFLPGNKAFLDFASANSKEVLRFAYVYQRQQQPVCQALLHNQVSLSPQVSGTNS